MADGEFTVKLDAETTRRVRDAADAAGVAVETYLADVVAGSLQVDWAEDLARIAEYERTGESLSVGEFLTHFDHELARRRRS